MKTLVQQQRLRVELLDVWHVGSGRGAGHYLDAVIDRDADGFPYVPGRMLRGLLRDACEFLQKWNHVAPGTVEDVFGGIVPSTDEPGRSSSRCGRLAVSSARLPKAVRAALHQAGGGVCAALFLDSFQTALDPATGTARTDTLRGIELAVPLTLESVLEVSAKSEQETLAAWALLEAATPLVLSLGAHKTRGHGRARLTFERRESA